MIIIFILAFFLRDNNSTFVYNGYAFIWGQGKGEKAVHMIRCNRCKQPFQVTGLSPGCCPQCHQKEEEEYMRVRALVKERPGIPIGEVIAITGISYTRIWKYISDERLDIVSSSI